MLEKLEGFYQDNSKSTSIIEINDDIDIQLMSESGAPDSNISDSRIKSFEGNLPVMLPNLESGLESKNSFAFINSNRFKIQV